MGALGYGGRWMRGDRCGEVGARRWVKGGACEEVGTGRCMQEGGCGEVEAWEYFHYIGEDLEQQKQQQRSNVSHS